MGATDEGAMDDSLVILGAGTNGVEEMQDLLDDKAVQWALIRFEFGSGTFTRKKMLFLHLNGEECPVLRRGQANAYTSEAQRLLRAGNQEGFHASLSVTRKEDVTEEQLLARVGHFFVKDDIDYSYQLERHEFNLLTSKVPLPNAKTQSAAVQQCPRPCVPGHLRSSLFSSGREALKAVAGPFGRWNWVLLRPDTDLKLVSGGTGSVDEMRECLREHDEDVLYGLLRLSFGAGRLRRTKHVFVFAVGERVPVVSRGRLLLARPQMEATVGKLVHCSVSLEVTRIGDFTLEEVIDRVRRSTIVDDDVLEGDGATRSAYSIEAFRDALKEEALEEPGTPPAEVQGAQSKWSEALVSEVVKLVHAPNGPLNWVLFGPNLQELKRRSLRPSRPSGQSLSATPVGGFEAAKKREGIAIKTLHTW